MEKLLTHVGGVLAGYVLTELPLDGTMISSLEPVLDGVGIVSMVLFSGTLIYKAVKTLMSK
ncbi:hypothetical protein PV433_01840 [Paenibacillus sp. GYB004]|uniref:hypothetical protein n=1 Tax=Paenibacillus sp. GYB004 TaxID=2994393 RepID=UPI002F961C0C